MERSLLTLRVARPALVTILKDGLEVSREEIADATVVPPSKISPQQRAELIERLTKAKQADEYKMNNVNGDSYGHNLLRAQATRQVEQSMS